MPMDGLSMSTTCHDHDRAVPAIITIDVLFLLAEDAILTRENAVHVIWRSTRRLFNLLSLHTMVNVLPL